MSRILHPQPVGAVAAAPLAAAARTLLEQQKQAWPMLAENFRAVERVRTRELDVDGLEFRLQFNPARLVSTTAKIDTSSISARACFLCEQNLPPEQRALDAGDGWRILANPFPILPSHYTIPRAQHTPQRIDGSFEKLLDLAREFGPEFTVFYNGPRCGASAPDHLHFQAGDVRMMPLFGEVESLASRYGRRIREITVVAPPLRPFFLIEHEEAARAAAVFSEVAQTCNAILPADDEPMMNVLAVHTGAAYRVVVLPRMRHRPSFYDANGDDRILLSPACIDLAGLCVVPIEHDFARIDASHLRQMLSEVCASAQMMGELARKLDRR